MWNLFRWKNRDSREVPAAAAEAGNRIDNLANELQRAGRMSELEVELAKFDLNVLNKREQESWWHLYGIAALRENRNAEALNRFQLGSEKFPGSAAIRFSLGQQYIRQQSIERGFALFRTCSFPEISREFAFAQARYAYLWNHYNDGLTFLRPFFEAYKRIRILDDHFLYVRGLPFFGQWWSYVAAFCLLAGDLTELEEITKFATQNCSDFDFDHLAAQMAAYCDSKPGLLLASLEKRLAAMPVGNFPTGHTRMNIAVIKARGAASSKIARELLSAVVLTKQDSTWLEDVRTLALAEVANRFGELDVEVKESEKFLIRQPMLLEPDTALEFQLLAYQERLKPRPTVS